MTTFTRALICTCVVSLWAAADVSAQTFQGGLRGTVRDANGVIPGVPVTLTNEATSVSRETVSNEAGEYSFPAVNPGTYTLTVALAGFRTHESTGIRIATQQFVTLDVLLEVGALEETITVTGEAPLIDTARADTGGVLDRTALEMLPAPGRNAFLIGVTVPSVNPVGDPQFNRQQDQTNASRVSLGGGGIRANNYLVDGVPIGELRGRAVLNPTIEAIEEVKVQVHTYDAEMGRTGGGVFNVTGRSGANEFHGSGFYQTRPVWGQSLNHFNEVAGLTKEETGLADAYYRLYGGGIGGPVFRNRTFFWTATEGYRSLTTRNQQYLIPSLRQRNGDFSQTTIGGAPVQLFNPYCRGGVANAQCPAAGSGSIATGGLFTGGVIPRNHPAASEVGFNLANAFPTEDIQGNPIQSNEDNEPNLVSTANVIDKADMWTLKMDHRFTDTWSMSGLYIYNRTDEPGSFVFADAQAFMDPDHWILRRRPHVLVFNNTNILNDTTVLTLRYGWTTWDDSCEKVPFSAGLSSLGFSPNFVNAVAETDVFPDLDFDEGTAGAQGGIENRWLAPFAVNGTLSKLWGSHSLKVGFDAREMGVRTQTEDDLGGNFDFDSRFTSLGGVGGHEFASLLLGLPYAGSVPFNRGDGEWFTRYYGAYVQDDWRVSSRFTLNYGVRFEHEDGLREIDNRQTVAFDRSAVNPIDALVPKAGSLLQGRTLNGGLIFAGVNGAPVEQGDPPGVKVSPRIGTTFSLNNRTVIRGGYGLFYAPWNYNQTQHGQIGFSRTTTFNQSALASSEVPLFGLADPFPGGLEAPLGSSLGLLTGVGGEINFIDQTKGAPRVHQYSVDIQHELPGNMALTVGYMGATGRDIGFAGTNNVSLNINQIDPNVARAAFPGPNGTWDAAALRRSVPNPFFGIAEAGVFGTLPTIPQGQLLRPFPQFGDINMFEATEGGRRQYHAAMIQLDKRVGAQSWWGGRYSYTWSLSEDNQFGESSTFQTRTAEPQNVYDLDAEYGRSNFDSPHRIILAPIVQFPSVEGSGVARWLASGWSASAIVELVSGSPLNAVMSGGRSDANLGLFGGRQRPNLVGDPNTSGSDVDRVASADHPDARFFDANAFADPGAGQYGNAPRTITDARLQFRKNIDLVLAKSTRFAGGQSGQIRFEILNLTNTPKFGGASNNPNLSSFGRITSQRGFSRIWQLTFRYQF